MRHLARPLLGVVLGSLLLGGCGGSTGGGSAGGGSTGGSSPSSSATPTSAAPSSAPASSGPTTSSSRPTAAECRVGDLRFSLSPGEGAAGSTYFKLRMTNTTQVPCASGGYGGVSLVAKPGGAPIGAPADRVEPGRRSAFTLRPGEAAEATLRETDAGNYPRSRCHPAPAHGLRVYPPNETHSTFVPHATTACSAGSVHLLQLSPYAPVQ
jgi:uncharacterized protein DUF4232